MFKKIDKPWGYEIIWAHTDKYVGKILKIYPNCKLSLQYHEKKVETVYVNHGTLKLHLRDEKDSEDKIKYLSKGESFHIPANTIHRFSSTEDGEVELVEVSTPELDDVIRIQDDYGRK